MQLDKTLRLLGGLPHHRRLAYLMRHSARYPITNERETFTAGLTPEGVALARAFGAEVGKVRHIGKVYSSPVGRCVDTALAMSRSAGWKEHVRIDNRLSHPYIAPVYNALPICYPGDSFPRQLNGLVEFIFDRPEQAGVVDLFVTHDTVVAALAGYLFCEKYSLASLPDYLEGVFLWEQDGQIQVLWRGRQIGLPITTAVGQPAYQYHLGI